MDTKRFPKTTRLPAFRIDLANKMQDLPSYDTVIVGDDNAFSFALSEQNNLFRGIPIVFLAVNNISKAVSQNNNPQVTGVVEEASGESTLKLMKRLYPTAAKIFILHEEITSTGKANTRRTRQGVRKLGLMNAEFISTSQLSYNELWAKLASLPAGAPRHDERRISRPAWQQARLPRTTDTDEKSFSGTDICSTAAWYRPRGSRRRSRLAF